jgi:hypothetical protein
MTDTLDDLESFNVAATLRDITANSDKVTGKILKKAEKAAHQGKSYILVSMSTEDRLYIDNPNSYTITPLVEKLKSLGFTVSSTHETSFWSSSTDYLVKVSW